MKKLDVKTIETELDPTFPYAKRVNNWKIRNLTNGRSSFFIILK